MTWVAVALGVVGLLVLAGVHSGGTRAYFRIAGDLGPVGAVFLVASTLLFLPNLATWLVAGAAGAPAVSLTLFGTSCSLVSYAGFPSGPAPPGAAEPLFGDPCSMALSGLRLDAAPWGYFFFLIIPIAATSLGGWRAARAGQPRSRGEAAAVGALAGVVFAFAFLGLMVLSRVTAAVSGPLIGFLTTGGGFALGPGLMLGFLVALGWGAGLGSLGAVVAARRVPPPPDALVTTELVAGPT
jgi:hypothetical protein